MDRPVSATTERARAFVEAHLTEARALGDRVAEDAFNPTLLVAALKEGMGALADPEYLEGQRRIAPGIGQVAGVRQALLDQVSRGLLAATRRDRPSTALDIADHCYRDPLLELHWLANDLVHRAIGAEPERAWQLVRRESRNAADWITVDNLAHVAARGILLEPYRWAELEQLVYSPSRWERRLAGSTVATLPFEAGRDGRTEQLAVRGLAIVEQLIGDHEPDVAKALSWALRNLAAISQPAVTAFLERETVTATTTDDGHRAWVIRDSLAKIDTATAARLRGSLDGIRRRPGAPSTSRASAAAADFLSIGLAVPPAERTVIDRS